MTFTSKRRKKTNFHAVNKWVHENIFLKVWRKKTETERERVPKEDHLIVKTKTLATACGVLEEKWLLVRSLEGREKDKAFFAIDASQKKQCYKYVKGNHSSHSTQESQLLQPNLLQEPRQHHLPLHAQ